MHLMNKTPPAFRTLTEVVRIHPVLATLAVVSLFVALASSLVSRRIVVLNLSESAPIGLYRSLDTPPRLGSLVEFSLPLPPGDTASNTPILRRVGMYVLKPIAAGTGDHVDTSGAWLVINGIRLAPMQTLDSEGRRLSAWRANRVLRKNEFFVLSSRVWNSLDSRYFGPIDTNDIVAVRAPLITWGGP